MMPFCTTFDPVYDAIKLACDSLVTPVRVDEMRGPDVIVGSIFKAIEEAKLVIADLTDQNANVLYEAGLAHGRGRHVVFLTQHPDHVPFDLRSIRYIEYQLNDRGLEELTRNLHRTICEYLDES